MIKLSGSHGHDAEFPEWTQPRSVGADRGAFCLPAAGCGRANHDIRACLTAYRQAVAENLSKDSGMAAFYRSRDFAPIWTGPDDTAALRRAALIEALGTAQAHGLPARRYDLDGLIRRLRHVEGERARGELEVELSRTFLAVCR